MQGSSQNEMKAG